MTDLLSIGASGVRVYQNALEVVGDNITNANTVGYARREARITQGAIIGPGFPLVKDLGGGSGVDVDGIRRAYDAFRSEDARIAGGDYSRLESRQKWLTELQSAVGTGSNSVGAGLTRFFNAAQDVATDPNSGAPRLAFVEAADGLAVRFRASAEGIENVRTGIRAEIDAQVGRANELASSLADINRLLRRAQANTADMASLRDRRDVILEELSSMMRLSVDEKLDGSVNIRLGDANGPSLVTPQGAKLLNTRLVGERTEVTVDPFGGNLRVPLSGGSLAGLVEAEARTVDLGTQLDTLATGFVDAINARHGLGLDQQGNAGGNIFDATRLVATPSPTNAGAASVVVGIDDAANIAPDGYELVFDRPSMQWTLSRNDGGGSVSGLGTLTLDGIRVEPGGAPANADRFEIVAKRGAAGLSVALSDGAKIAAAAPWRADRVPGNQGSGTVDVRVVSSAATLPAYSVRMTDASNYEIVDPATSTVLATGAYTPGAWVAVDGIEFRLSGAPATGDSFTLALNAGGVADNANMRALVALRLPEGGGFEQRYERQVTSLASALGNTKSLAEASLTLRDAAVAARDSIMAVNLDQEAADLLRFQQAYQASTKIIAAAQQLFATMIEL